MWVLSKHAGMGHLCVWYTDVYVHMYCSVLACQLDMARVTWEDDSIEKMPLRLACDALS